MAKQLYDYWFVQFDFPNEDGKPYKSSGGAMVWNEKLKRRIPEGWNVMSINEICTSCRGVSYGKDDLLSDSNGVLVLRGNNIENNRIVYDSNVAFVPNDFVSEEQHIKEGDTIIYSTVRPRLKHYGILSRPQNNFIISTGFTTIDIKDLYKDKIDPRYLYLLLTQPTITDYIGNIADTAVSAYPSINPSDLSSLCFMFPDYDIQKTIADIWNNYDRKIELNRAINQNLPILDHSLRAVEVRLAA